LSAPFFVPVRRWCHDRAYMRRTGENRRSRVTQNLVDKPQLSEVDSQRRTGQSELDYIKSEIRRLPNRAA
jgi:hypothetical protein